MSARIEAVVFDVGKVIVEWDLRLLYTDLIPDPAQRDWFVENVVTPDWHWQHDAGGMVADTIPARQAEYPEHAALIAHYAENFADSIPGPVPGTLALIEALDDAGVPLYAITNFGAEFWRDFHPTWPVFERFRDIVVSGVEKMVKPDAAIYRLAEARFGHAPEAMLFIDDSLPNVEAARACGWQAHHFIDSATLEADLRVRGLL